MPKLTKSQEQALLRDYLNDDHPQSSAQIAEKYGITRQTLYSVLRRNGVQPERRQPSSTQVPDVLLDRMAQQALHTLIDELADAQNRIRVYEGALRKAGVDPDSL